MSEMIERVAKAISECHSGRDWRGMSEYGKDWWREEARAAIEAMREPTEAMETAGQVDPLPISTNASWKAMIDEALK